MVLSTLRLGLAFLLASHAACLTLEKRQSCTGQSCIVANIAGNSGVPVDPSKPPQGDTVKGDCCVIRYNPAVTELAYQFKPQLKTQCAKYNNRRDLQDAEPLTDDQEMYKRSIELLSEDMDLEDEAGLETRQIGCAAKTLVYAKGTFEPGALGVTLGPKLKQALLKLAPGQWDVEGVDYQPSTDGDYCLGLPGGVAGKQLIQSIAAKCPRTKLFVAGYSQGAMVVRNGLGNSTAGARVKGVLTFGDPFNGSPIKNYNGPIQTYCASGDGVCSGNFDISGAHLSYGSDVTPGAQFLNSL